MPFFLFFSTQRLFVWPRVPWFISNHKCLPQRLGYTHTTSQTEKLPVTHLAPKDSGTQNGGLPEPCKAVLGRIFRYVIVTRVSTSIIGTWSFRWILVCKFYLDLLPTNRMPWNIFRFGNPNPKLRLLLLLGKGLLALNEIFQNTTPESEKSKHLPGHPIAIPPEMFLVVHRYD